MYDSTWYEVSRGVKFIDTQYKGDCQGWGRGSWYLMWTEFQLDMMESSRDGW